jgi:probable phosphoglycerate mutase
MPMKVAFRYPDASPRQAERFEVGCARHPIAARPPGASRSGAGVAASPFVRMVTDEDEGAGPVAHDDRPELWLIRHGETEWSRAGRHTGRTDVPLTPAGVEQATALRGRLGERRFALVLSSPLRRAWETCRLAGLAGDARRTDDLLEWDYGAYEGRTAAEIQGEIPGWSLWAEGVPAGETVEEVGARARRVIDEATRTRGDVALFAHGHVLRVLAACWLGLTPREGRLFALGTAGIGVLGHEHERRVIWRWNV